MFASIGAYATDGSAMGLYLLLVMGVLSVLMRRFGLPIVPIIIGVILGPLAEQQLRRAPVGYHRCRHRRPRHRGL